MLRFIATRIALAIPTLLAISFLVFFAAYLSPSDPVDLLSPQRATPEEKARTRHQWGLDRPPLVRYGDYVWRIVSRGDFGRSYMQREPVTDIIKRGFPNTALLASLAMGISLLFGVPLGILSAVYANRWPDRLLMSTALAAVAVPSFVLGPVLVLYLAVHWKLPYVSILGFSLLEKRLEPKYFVLPVLVLAARSTALIARLTRSTMLDTLGQDYIWGRTISAPPARKAYPARRSFSSTP
jgi:peptide/nickel transport system permease protein